LYGYNAPYEVFNRRNEIIVELEQKFWFLKKRIKHCNVCKVDFSTMYRVQYKAVKEWVFVCEDCLIKVKENNTNYKYGGTWKKWGLNF
jgi:hypothetical protein